MLDRIFERERLNTDKESFLDRIFKAKDTAQSKERESILEDHLSLYDKLKKYDTSENVTYNLVKMSLRDKFRFLTTKNFKSAHKLLTGRLDEDRIENYKLCARDLILYKLAQTNKGIITEKNIRDYVVSAYPKAHQDEILAGIKLRLHTLRSAGCVNDIGRGKYEKYEYHSGIDPFVFYARKNVKYEVTHIYANKLDSLIEDARQYRLNEQSKIILDAFKNFATKEEVIDHLSSYYTVDLDTRQSIIQAYIWKLENFGYLERIGDTYFTNLEYEFEPKIDLINQQILHLASKNPITEENMKSLYEKYDIPEEDIPFIADARLAQLKMKEYIDGEGRLTEKGKIIFDNVLDDIKEKLNNKQSLTIMELCIQGFKEDEYKRLLQSLYDEDIVEKLLAKSQYTLDNLKMLNFIDENCKITPDGLMFIERSKYIQPDKDNDRLKIKEVGYFEKQILSEVQKGNMDFKDIQIGDLEPHKIEHICKTHVMNLSAKGYLELEEGNFKLQDRAKDLLYKDNYKITNFDTKNILESSSEGIFTKESFCQYQQSLGKTDEQIDKSYAMILKRLESHIHNNMISKDGDRYILSDDFIVACGKNPESIKKTFVLNDYDKNILSLINKKIFSKEGVLNELKTIYGEDAQRRYYVMRSRAKVLIKEGYISINEQNFYSLTETGKAALDDYKYKLSYFDYKTFLETSIDGIFSKNFYGAYYSERGFTQEEIRRDEARINSRLELHLNRGLLKKIDDDLYMITDEFWDKYKEDYLITKYFELSRYDKFILNLAENKIIDVEKYISGLKELKETNADYKGLYNKEKMMNNRLLLLEREGYVTKIDEKQYFVTDKHLIKKDKTTGERIDIGRFDKKLYSKLEELGLKDGFTLEDLADVGNERDIRMFTGRCAKLQNSGYLIEVNGKLLFTKDFLDKIGEKKVERKEIKITQFDVNRIYRCSKEGVFNKITFENGYMGKLEDFDKEFLRIEKRLTSLKAQGYVALNDKGEYELRNKFMDECREHEKKLLRMKNRDQLDLNREQQFILKELQSFLNISQRQFCTNMDLSNELKNLYDRGILDYEYRLINGERTKVFYLTSEGKQVTSKLTGVRVANIYSSKIHSRPEELEHDVLIYSAYQDAKIRLLMNNKQVIDIKNDREMRSDLYNDRSYQIADLEIEYVDIKTGEKGNVNIEVDLGYSEDTIAKKASGIKNLVWYTNSDKQMEKIQKIVPKARVIKL